MNDLTHLPIGGSEAAAHLALRQRRPEMHGSLFIHAVAESRFAQRARKGREQVRGHRLIVPNVCAVAMATAALIVGTLETPKPAVGGAETYAGRQSREIGRSRVFHRGRESALPQPSCELTSFPLEAFQVLRNILSSCPSVGEACRVPIANDRVFLSLRRLPAAPCRRAVRKMPGEQKGVVALGCRGDCPAEAERPDGIPRGILRSKPAVGREIVPEQQRSVPPPTFRPAAEMRKITVSCVYQPDDEVAPHGVVGPNRGVVHE